MSTSSLFGLATLAAAMITAVPAIAEAAAPIAVQQWVSATISGGDTIDTYGLFGLPHANLVGDTITIFTQYVPSSYSASLGCGSGCTYYNSKRTLGQPYSTQNPTTPDSALIVVSLNGQHVAYAPSAYGQVEFDNGSGFNYFSISTDVALYNGYPGCVLSLAFTAPVAFGAELSPKNNPVLNSNNPQDSITFYTGTGNNETLTFTATQAAD